jgi:uncharacterized membrane protein
MTSGVAREDCVSERTAWAAVAVIALVGAVLRLANLGAESIWYDEAASWEQAKDSFSAMLQRTAGDNYPPLHNIFLFIAIKALGDSEWALRLPSALFGIANIAAIYWLGRLTVGRAAGLLGAALLALAPFHLLYSQEARMYSLLALTATMFAATSFYYVRRPSPARAVWVLLAGLSLVYAHPYGLFNWAAVALAVTVLLLIGGQSHRSVALWLAANAAILIGFAPWAVVLARRAGAISRSWLPEVDPGFVAHSVFNILGGRVMAIVLGVGLLLALWSRLRGSIAVLCVWALAPIAIGVGLSLLFKPMLMDRYIIAALPPVLLLSAYGFTRYAPGLRSAAVSGVAVVLVSALALLRTDPYAPRKEDWRSIAGFLAQHRQPGDCVLVMPDHALLGLAYYRQAYGCMLRVDTPENIPETIPGGHVLALRYGFKSGSAGEVADAMKGRGWTVAASLSTRSLGVVKFARGTSRE